MANEFVARKGLISLKSSSFDETLHVSGSISSPVEALLTSSWAIQSSTSSYVSALVIGNPILKSQSELESLENSSGWLTGGAISDNGDGTVKIGAGSGQMHLADNSASNLYYFEWNEISNLAVTDNQTCWIMITVSGNTPIISSSTTAPNSYIQNQFCLGAVFLRDGICHVTIGPRLTVSDHAGRTMRALSESNPYANAGGGEVTSSGLNFSVSPGTWWNGLTRVTSSNFDTTTGSTFTYFWTDGYGVNWYEITGSTQIDNTQWNNTLSGVLEPLSPNHYGVHWIYSNVYESSVHVVYGNGNYTSLFEAQNVTEPRKNETELPSRARTIDRLIARVIVKQGINSIIELDPAYNVIFRGADLIEHNSTLYIQGGKPGEYYHLTQAGSASVSALGNLSTQNSGSVNITGGTVTASFQGNLNGTSSYSNLAKTASYVGLVDSASYSFTSSFSYQASTASFSTTASYVSLAQSSSYSLLSSTASHVDGLSGINTGDDFISQGSGLIRGGLISRGNTSSSFNITSGSGIIVDNTSSQAVVYNVSWPNYTNVQLITGSSEATYVYIDRTGSIVQNSVLLSEDFENYVMIGYLSHPAGTIIDTVTQESNIAINPVNQFQCLVHSLGVVNGNGNTFYASGSNLQLNKTGGSLYYNGINWASSSNAPNHRLYPDEAPKTFRYRYQNGSSSLNTTTIDPNTYDVGGISTSVPSQKFTIQRVYQFISGNVRIQLGQYLYNSIAEAVSGFSTENFVLDSSVALNGVLRAILVVKQGATNLNDPTQAYLLNAGKLGEIIIGGAGVAVSASYAGYVDYYNVGNKPALVSSSAQVVSSIIGQQISPTGITSSLYGTSSYALEVVNPPTILADIVSTQLSWGGELTINQSDLSKFDLNSGSGIVVNNWDDSSTNRPTVTSVFWTASIGLSLPNIASSDTTYVGIDINGNISYLEDTDFDEGSKRDTILLGWLDHVDRSTINFARLQPSYGNSLYSQLYDFVDNFGTINISGNDYFASGSLHVGRTAGKIFENGSNYPTSKKSPNIISSNRDDRVEMYYTWRSGSSGLWNFTDTSSIVDPNNYDDNGVLTAVSSGSWTIQVFSYYPSMDVNDVQYGQAVYSSYEDAAAHLQTAISINPYDMDDTFRAWLVVKSGSTDLTDGTHAKFISMGKFGIVSSQSGGSTSTGEINTVSNQGLVGVGLYLQKVGVDLQFKNISSGNQLSVTDDTPNRSVKIQISASQASTANYIPIGDSSGKISASWIPLIDSSSYSYTASYVNYNSIGNKPTLVSSSVQVSYPSLSNIPIGIISSSVQLSNGGSAAFSGASNVTFGSITASAINVQQLNVTSISSSVIYSSGSNTFGNSAANIHQFTGSVLIQGPVTASSGFFGTASYSQQSNSSSYSISSSLAALAKTASYVDFSVVANKPTLVSSSAQVSYTGLSNIPTNIISASAQFTTSDVFNIGQVTASFNGNLTGTATTASYVLYSNVANKPSLVSSSAQILYNGITNIPAGIMSSSAQTLTNLQSSGIYSSSVQIFTLVQGSGIVSSSAQVVADIVGQQISPAGITSSLVGTSSWSVNSSTSSYLTGSKAIIGSLTASFISASVISASSFYSDVFNATVSTMSVGYLTVTQVINGTSSWAQNAQTASYVPASGIDVFKTAQDGTSAGGLLISEHFLSSTTALINTFASTISGTGAAVNIVSGSVTHPGVIQLTTGTGTTSRVSVVSQANCILFGSGSYIFEADINLQVLSSAAQRYIFYAGFGGISATGDMTNGAYFQYTDSASTFWQIKTAANSVRTTTTTSVTATAGTWYKLKVIVNNVASSDFYINDVYVGSIATNIPSIVGRETGIIVKIEKTVGGTASTSLIDFIKVAYK